MNIRLVYQKVYFKDEEWQNVVSFFQDIKVTAFLLSKNIFLSSLKTFKNNMVGDCLVVTLPLSLGVEITNDSLKKLLDFVALIRSKYSNKLYLICFLLEKDNNLYCLSVTQLESYFSYYDYKKGELEGYFLPMVLLKELHKLFASIDLSKKMSAFFITKPITKLNNIFSYYY